MKSPPSEQTAVVVLRMEDLCLWTIERVAKMPRDHKFTIGDRLVETCLDITNLLCEAAYTRERLPLLQRASRALTRARLLVRLAQRLRLLSIDQREHFASESTEIGQMIGGWTKATRARYTDPVRARAKVSPRLLLSACRQGTPNQPTYFGTGP